MISRATSYNSVFSAYECELKGARFPVVDKNDQWIGEYKSKDPAKPNIKIQDIHIDSSSHTFDSEKDYVGLIVYLCDEQADFELEDVHCKTGDIYIKQTDWILANTPERRKRGRYVHGRLFHSIFGCWKTKDLRFVGAGFSYYDGHLTFNSGTLNTMNSKNNDDTYHNSRRALDKYEKQLIKRIWIHLYENHRWLEMSPGTRVNWKDLPELEKPPCIDLAKVHPTRRLHGTLCWLNDDRGYGFIKCIGRKEDIFVHFSEIQDRPMHSKPLKVGEDVEFNVVHGYRGWRAINVTTSVRH